MRTEDSQGSGYATRDFEDFNDMDTLKFSQVAAKKATGSIGAKAIEPGKYTVILEPAAGIVIVGTIVRWIGCPQRRRRPQLFKQSRWQNQTGR